MFRSALAWMRSITSSRRTGVNRCAYRFWSARYSSTGTGAGSGVADDDLAALGLEDGEQPLSVASRAIRTVSLAARCPSRAGTAPARAGSARRASPWPSPPWPRGRAGPRRSPWRRTGSRGPSRCAARPCPGRRRCRGARRRPAWSRSGRPAGSRPSAARRCSCSPRCRSRRTSTSSLRSNIPDRHAKPMSTVPPSPPWRDDADVVACPVARSAGRDAGGDRGRVAEQGVQPATRHDVSGNGVEKTSRQPVALTVTILPPVARMAASSTYRAPSASPQPWQARWPDVSELARSCVGLHAAQLGVEQPVADREAADLVELHRRGRS